MRRFAFIALAGSLLAAAPAWAKDKLERLNKQLAGRIVDHTHNHGKDCRIKSAALCAPRDCYVYLPPGYSPDRPCNLVFWFHGAFGDEQIMFALARLDALDYLICKGMAPPTIVVCPDCSIGGQSSIFAQHSFMADGKAGCFERWFVDELVPFITSNYAVRPERESHALAGVSAGGLAAMQLGMRHRDYFGTIAALAPPANLRYDTCKHRYHEDFDPATYRWRDDYRPRNVVGTFFGVVRLREREFIAPIFGPKPDVIEHIRKYNPADLLFSENIQPGELNIYLHYPGQDNFNFDAQVQSFVWLAKSRGIDVAVGCDPDAHHTVPYFQDQMVPLWMWLGQTMPPAPPIARK